MYVSLQMDRGDDRAFVLSLVEDGAALDLTGADVRITAKRSRGDSDDDAILVATVGDGITVDADPTSGVATWSIAADDTSTLEGLVRLPFDVQVTRGGSTRTVLRGRLTIDPDISRTAP